MTITIGWWIIPTIITIIALICGLSPKSGSSNFMSGIGEMINGLFATIAILVIWLIYFIIF